METYDVLIVGGGHGGAQAATALRQRGFSGALALLGDEAELPYDRPSLSKEYLLGDKSFERMLIRPRAFWDERNVTLLLGRRVTSVDPAARTVTTATGERLGYSDLIWATGGTPRRLTCVGHDLAGTHMVRTRDDIDRLLDGLVRVDRIVVIGGGYIGLEAAAALNKLGKHVTLLEALPRVLSRVAGKTISAFYAAEHRARGVDLRTDASVRCIEGDDAVRGVRLDDGTVLPCDRVIVGIGIAPAVAPLLAAGAEGGNGVRVDAACRTSVSHVYAIGDCALHDNAFAGHQEIRLESVQNANDMAITVARAIMGEDAAYHATPWFWSTQYDLKLQTVGLSAGHDAEVVRGDPATRSFSVVYLKNGRVIALDCVNSVKDYVQGRRLVEARASVNLDQLIDPAIPLNKIEISDV